MQQQALSVQELDELKAWVERNKGSESEGVVPLVEKLMAVYLRLLKHSGRGSLELLKLLRQAMGITPKSERGSQEKHEGAIRG